MEAKIEVVGPCTRTWTNGHKQAQDEHVRPWREWNQNQGTNMNGHEQVDIGWILIKQVKKNTMDDEESDEIRVRCPPNEW